MVTRCHVLAAIALGFVVALPGLASAQSQSPSPSPTGHISGRVLNTDGGAPPAIRVEARRLAAGGSRSQQATGSVRASDDGSYRITGLPAGDYSIAAVPILDAGTPGQPEAPPATYYPGVLDELEAQAVSLAQSGEVSGVDFRLRTDPGVRVTGVMVSHNQKPLRTGQVTMSPVDQSGTVVGPTARARIYPDGGFFFLNILPGRYLLRASGQTFADRQSLVASQTVEVGSTSVTGLRLVLQPGGAAPVQSPPAPPAATTPAPPSPPAGAAAAPPAASKPQLDTIPPPPAPPS